MTKTEYMDELYKLQQIHNDVWDALLDAHVHMAQLCAGISTDHTNTTLRDYLAEVLEKALL
jgi:hypothetical protein